MLNVRRMQVSDIDRVYEIELSSHRAPWSRDILRDCVLVGYQCLVLEKNDKEPLVIAYVICRHNQGICHILNLCVDTRFQGQGHGRYLLNELINNLSKVSTNVLMLEVRPSNQAAISLYESFGFQRDGVKAGYYNDDKGIEEDALVLKKVL